MTPHASGMDALRRNIQVLLATIILPTLCLSGCRSSEPGGDECLVAGYWEAEFAEKDANASERFIFQFGGKGRPGTVHTYQDGVKLTELPIDRLRFAEPDLTFYLEATAVGFEGKANLEEGTITGGLRYRDGSSIPITLSRVDASTLSGIDPRPSENGEPYRYVYREPEARNDGWETSTPIAEHLAPDAIAAAVEEIVARKYGVLHSLLIARNGRLVVEEYFYGHGRDTLHAQQSVTKSVTSLLVGIALDQGRIPSVDEEVFAFFPEYADLKGPGWENVRLRHLLSMTAGLGWDSESQREFDRSDNFFEVPLSRPVVKTPGSEFEYAGPNVNLLGGVIRQATGMHADAFAETYLFAPLGIHNYDWSRGQRRGDPRLDGTLSLCSRDMLKIGQMVLDGGTWRGERIVSEDYIREMLREHTNDHGKETYGYLWWGAEREILGRTVQASYANGWGSQFIVVLPELNMVVVTTGGNQDNGMHLAALRMIAEHIAPAAM
jgi:CubicO group peptidase (beta-lactamase class C family)